MLIRKEIGQYCFKFIFVGASAERYVIGMSQIGVSALSKAAALERIT
jgi:hypothetical protein